jgi:hypothetical protein
MPKTVSAAEYVRRSARVPEARRKAIDLLQALAAVECSFTVGGAAGVPPGLLRDLVLITAELAGRTWLEAKAESAAAAKFVALNTTRQPPLLPELDQILATVLLSRFAGLAAATATETGQPSSPMPSRAALAATASFT